VHIFLNSRSKNSTFIYIFGGLQTAIIIHGLIPRNSVIVNRRKGGNENTILRLKHFIIEKM